MKAKKVVKALLIGLGSYIGWLLISFLTALAGAFLFPDQEDVFYFLSVIGPPLATLIILGIFALCGRPFRQATSWMPRRASLGTHLGAAAFGICANEAVSALLNLLPLPEEWLADYAQESQGVYNPNLALLSVFFVAILAPVFEELFFRGCLFGVLREGISFWPAVLISALFFGLAHGQPLWICYAALLGVLLAVIAGRSGTVTLSIAVHLGFNLTSVPTLFDPNMTFPWWSMALSGLAGAVGAVLLWRKVLFPKKKNTPRQEG